MKKLLAIGEALIDMIPSNTGRIMDVNNFTPKVGGAPLNVCGAYTKLGGSSNIITMLGKDPFGDKIVNELIGFSYKYRLCEAYECCKYFTCICCIR